MRSVRYLTCLLILFLFLWTVFAAISSDTYIATFESQQAKLTSSQKKTYYDSVIKSMSSLMIKYRDDANQIKELLKIKAYVSDKLKTFSGSSVVVSSGMTIPKVDLVKVRAAWLALHNAERKTKKLSAYTYTSSLEWTATVRAKHLAALGKATHSRKTTDGYYSYTSIKQRFIDQWIAFATKEKNGQTLFTENLWRGYYTCKKSDCTDDFIKAITTSWTFFMSEKGKSSKPHYNAIVGNYQHIGLGVALIGKKYYLVTHYTQALK
jgi:uncharacterized protein YkwD